MGLDVDVYPYIKIPDEIKTSEELDEYCNSKGWYWLVKDRTCKNFPDEHTKLISCVVDDWESTFKNRGLNFKNYKWISYGDTIEFINKINKTIISFKYEEIITKHKDLPVFIVSNSVGYQRKGANRKFYKNGYWDNDIIVSDRKILINHWNKYFSSKFNNYYLRNARKHFKDNIIKNFITGKTFVIYH